MLTLLTLPSRGGLEVELWTDNNGCVENETSGRISIALNFSHQLNPNLVIS